MKKTAANSGGPAAVGKGRLDEYAMQGMLLALLCSALAELVFSNFLLSIEYLPAIGRVAILFLTLYTIHRFSLFALTDYRPRLTDLWTLISVIFASILIVWLGRLIVGSLLAQAKVWPLAAEIDPRSAWLAIPYAAGALLLQSVLGMHFGLVFALMFGVIVAMYTPGYPLHAVFALTTAMVASMSLSRLRSRSAMLKAGLNITIISIPFALSSALLSGRLFSVDLAILFFAAILGGGLCYVIASGATPLIEALGGYVTDMRLLEMATLDHPLLKELSIQAPGTWNHSMVMGMMVEAAADAIGANPVLSRVGSYFHDIGKIKKPIYFVENQGGQENRHNKLSTSMSALIIRSHVKDGIDLARKHKVPKIITDMIPQHHGTSLIEYFYEKAKKEAQEAEGEPVEVDESLYSYPGPKPQTKEAGILMLADGIEAAVRTIPEPNHDRIRGLVQKMINKVFRSGQLNECDLTLRDLHQIAACFTRVLSGIYHQRVAYAEPAEKVVDRKSSPAQQEPASEDDEKRDGGTSEPNRTTPEQQNSARNPEKKPEEELKRLGM